MMITPAQRAEIRRLYFGEHWKVDTIATALGVHHQTVRRAIELDTRPLRRARRASTLDPVFPNASCAVALIDRLTHHADILALEGDSFRRREAELSQKQRRTKAKRQ